MTDAEYIDILATHGRRVANRAVLSATPLDQRLLSDFYDCYGPDSPESAIQESAEQGRSVNITVREPIGLPPHERCRTGLVDTFDPTGLHALYVQSIRATWADPENSETATEPPMSIDDATAARRLDATIAEAGRSIAATAGDDATKATSLIDALCSHIAGLYGVAADTELYNRIVDAANAALEAA